MEMLLVPRPSSLMEISATLIALLVEVFSDRDVMVLVSETSVGASFRSLMARLYLVLTGLEPSIETS